MRFFFPDSQDQIDPAFDFSSEEHSPFRVRQRDDRYAHEVLAEPPFDGILVSKAIVDGTAQGAGKYSAPQRARLYREGIRRFLRLDSVPDRRLLTMGDCGAFAYVAEDTPPYSVDEVIDFYDDAGFDLGVSVDHVILGFIDDPESALPGLGVGPEDWEVRRKITLENAAEFLRRHQARRCSFLPVGAAQGWSPATYADSVAELQRMGYQTIALGGMVPLKSQQIMLSLDAIQGIRQRATELHLLGVTRLEHLERFTSYGVTSFDSTSPFRRAFKDERDNYYTPDGDALTAVRVPQVEGNPKLKMKIRAGQIDQGEAVGLERECLDALASFERTAVTLDAVVDPLRRYEALWDGKKDRSDLYRKTLAARPWESCRCGICETSGIDVILFRGSERNKRRGFHNLYMFGSRLQRMLESATSTT